MCALKIAGRTVSNIPERKSESDFYGMLPAEGQMSKEVDINFIEEPAMRFPKSITDAILIKKTKQFSERLNYEDSLSSGSWLSCFKFLVLHFYDDAVFT